VNGDTVPVSVKVLDKEYMISCPEDEKESLIESARVLNEHMRRVRDSGKVLGTERMAVVTALNVIHESAQQLRHQEARAAEMVQRVRGLEDKVQQALDGGVDERTPRD